MKKTLSIRIHGRVQRVGYRNYFFQRAIELNLFGYVENNKDGTVFAIVQGTDGQVDQMLEYAQMGSPLSRVDRIEIDVLGEIPDLEDFRINSV